MRRSLPLMVVVSGLLLAPACGPPSGPFTPTIPDGELRANTVDANGTAPVVGATVTALGKACTTSLRGSCSISQMPPTTVSVTVAHADYNELTRDVVQPVREPYSDRMATIGWTDAARRAGARLARTATSMAIAGPTT